jgi:hypothetical protein
MRIAVLVAAAVVVGLVAQADGVSRRAVTSPDLDRLTASDSAASSGPAVPGHEQYRYRHGATYAVETGSTALACETACGADAVCQAWSFVEAYGESPARCELKQGGGKSEENLLATSGVSPRVDAAYWGVVEAAPPPTDTLAGEPPKTE